MLGVVIFKYESDKTTIDAYPDDIPEDIINDLREKVNLGEMKYKKITSIKIGENSYIVAPTFMLGEEDRPTPALIAVVCETKYEKKVKGVLEAYENKEIPSIRKFAQFIYTEIDKEIQKGSSIREKLKSKEEKMW